MPIKLLEKTTYRSKIIPADIENAVSCNLAECVIARALTRVTGLPISVSWWDGDFTQRFYGCAWLSDSSLGGGTGVWAARLSERMARYARDFDSGVLVQPERFSVTFRMCSAKEILGGDWPC